VLLLQRHQLGSISYRIQSEHLSAVQIVCETQDNKQMKTKPTNKVVKKAKTDVANKTEVKLEIDGNKAE
jgi:hypothetical protein